jgi:hypothetical protein
MFYLLIQKSSVLISIIFFSNPSFLMNVTNNRNNKRKIRETFIMSKFYSVKSDFRPDGTVSKLVGNMNVIFFIYMHYASQQAGVNT